MIPYTVHEDGGRRTITCGQCRRTSSNPEDVYFRYCGACSTFVGAAIRRRWNHNRPALRALCENFGRYKKVSYTVDGLARRVPTELILTEGIHGADLPKFPLWATGEGEE